MRITKIIMQIRWGGNNENRDINEGRGRIGTRNTWIIVEKNNIRQNISEKVANNDKGK